MSVGAVNLPVVPRSHVAGGGDEVDVEVEVLVLLEVGRFETELATVHRRQLGRHGHRGRIATNVTRHTTHDTRHTTHQA